MISSSTDRFLRVAGGRGPVRVLVATDGPGPERLFEFSQPFVLVGSHQRADLPLFHADIGGRHLYLQLVGGRLFGVHLSQRTTTRWGEEVRPSGWIDGRTVLRVGPYSLRFPDAGDVGADAGSPLSSGACPGPAVSLELRGAAAASPRAKVGRRVSLVGTLPICKLRIHHSSISAVHCSLVRTPEGLWVVDLASRSGVQVNGAVVRAALLDDGDTVDLGARSMRVSAEAAPNARSGAPAADDSVSFGPTELVTAGGTLPPSAADVAALLTALGPLLDRMSGSQAQTIDQFQDMIGMMIRAFGAMFNEHREFVKDELARLDQLARSAGSSPAGLPAPAKPPSQPPSHLSPAPDYSTRLPLVDGGMGDDQAHAWLQQRLLQELGDKRANLWEKMSALFRAKAPEKSGD